MESFHLQLQEEVESYERLKRGEFDDLENLRGLGHLLISVRTLAESLSSRRLDGDRLAFDDGERGAEWASGGGGCLQDHGRTARDSRCGFGAAGTDAVDEKREWTLAYNFLPQAPQ